MNLFLAIFLLLKAVYEGLRISHPGISQVVEVIMWVGLAVCVMNTHNDWFNLRRQVFYRSFWKTMIGLLLFWYAFFDVIWNISAGQSLNYIGVTKFWDTKILHNIYEMWGMSPIWFTRAIAALWAVAWLTKWGNK